MQYFFKANIYRGFIPNEACWKPNYLDKKDTMVFGLRILSICERQLKNCILVL